MSFLSRCCSNCIAFCIRHSVTYSSGVCPSRSASDAAVAVDRYRCSTHAFGVAEAVQLARVLERLPRRLLIYGIEGRRFDLGSAPSVEVVEASDRVALALAGGARV